MDDGFWFVFFWRTMQQHETCFWNHSTQQVCLDSVPSMHFGEKATASINVTLFFHIVQVTTCPLGRSGVVGRATPLQWLSSYTVKSQKTNIENLALSDVKNGTNIHLVALTTNFLDLLSTSWHVDYPAVSFSFRMKLHPSKFSRRLRTHG